MERGASWGETLSADVGSGALGNRPVIVPEFTGAPVSACAQCVCDGAELPGEEFDEQWRREFAAHAVPLDFADERVRETLFGFSLFNGASNPLVILAIRQKSSIAS